MPYPTLYYVSGGVTVLMSGELNSLANNAFAQAAVAYDNGSGYPLAEVELTCPAASFGPSGGVSALAVWFLRCAGVSGTYENGSGSFEPARAPDVALPLRSGSTRTYARCAVPPVVFLPYVKNDGTGVSLGASGNILRLAPLSFMAQSG